ncbi:ATP-binding protein [Pedobacter sp. AW31-3R]|uniref:ATP-binding protein n=1 Tax=Pedobacter sp. AW31-3R TaxID=3445781 RepID=UPI003FA11EDE
MIARVIKDELVELLEEFAAVAVLGPRQVGKTTLAQEIAVLIDKDYIYLDLESPADHAKLNNPEAYFELYKGNLIVLDEVQRVPELFSVLRGVIDRRRREGFKTGQFLILGSASLDLLKQSAETLAGRIAYKELSGFTAMEIGDGQLKEQDQLWLRGGFPDSFLARSDLSSLRWRMNFITTYLERDVPQLGPRIPAVTLRRMWTMLAYQQGAQINIVQLGANLDITGTTAKRYLELLEDLLLIRTLRPWSGNIGKRLVKSPKVYIRDSGLVHALLNLETFDDILSHPIIGASWEGFVIENLLSCLPLGITPWFYRTSAGAEIDLVLELSPGNLYAIEIKRSMAPVLSKGFYLACDDIKAVKRYIVYPGKESFPAAKDVMVSSLAGMMKIICGIQK